MTGRLEPSLLDDVLDGLELGPAQPGIGYLRRIFERFNERVPFETASKILRNAAIPDPAEKPRRPELFWAEHLEWGAGGTCFARVAAFADLAAGLGFEPRVVLGRVERDFDHAAILVRAGGEDWICDVGFPLPELVPARPTVVEADLNTLSVSETVRGYRVAFSDGVPIGPASLEVFVSPVSTAEYDARWRETFRADSKFLSGVAARKTRAGRAISFARGEVRIDDRHSRTRLPIRDSRPRRVAETFGMDEDRLTRAFALAGDSDPELEVPQIAVYFRTDRAADEAFEVIATPSGYRSLMEGVAQVTETSAASGAWRLRLAPREALSADAGSVEEEATVDREARSLRIQRRDRESFYRVEEHASATYLVRGAAVPEMGEELLRNDSFRGRLAGSLASDLLAWARVLGRSE